MKKKRIRGEKSDEKDKRKKKKLWVGNRNGYFRS
jgi:hypothetical protein